MLISTLLCRQSQGRFIGMTSDICELWHQFDRYCLYYVYITLLVFVLSQVKSTVDQNGRLMTCVSVNRLPVCNTRCNQKSIETSQEQFRCISRQHAQQLEVTPRIQGECLSTWALRCLSTKWKFNYFCEYTYLH